MATDDNLTGEVTTPYAAVVALSEQFAQEQVSSTPSIAAFLERVNADSRSTLFRNLLDLEIERRRANGERPQLDDYVARFSQFADQIRQAFLDAASLSSAVSQNQDTVKPKVAAVALPVAGRLGAYRLVGELGRG